MSRLTRSTTSTTSAKHARCCICDKAVTSVTKGKAITATDKIHIHCDRYRQLFSTLDKAMESVKRTKTPRVAELKIQITRYTRLPSYYSDIDSSGGLDQDDSEYDVFEDVCCEYLPIHSSVTDIPEWVYAHQWIYQDQIPEYYSCIGISTDIKILEVRCFSQ